MRILVTGGAGFVGANLALRLALRHSEWSLVALDNLRRRGSELNVPRLRDAGVAFVHGDVRDRESLQEAGAIDAIVECSADPSVLGGLDGDADYVVGTNLLGAHRCLELARAQGAALVFLSTSRVYPIEPLNRLTYREEATRFVLDAQQPYPGASADGISEEFPIAGARSLYGATKLAAELLIAEYVEFFGVRAVVNRCGVIAGPWQMGRVDQGFVAHWLASHHFGRRLRYFGYGGRGKQVRDLLHVDDLCDLIEEQLTAIDEWNGFVGNVGGGPEISVSLAELTERCSELTGNRVEVAADATPRAADVPIYVSDCARLFERTTWRPQRDVDTILSDVHRWILDNEDALRSVL